MNRINFDFGFGDLTISQSQHSTNYPARMSGAFHRLTAEQFDALTSAFDLTSKYGALDSTIETLTIEETGRTFRTADIDFGGLCLTLFADVPAEEVDENQLSLLDPLTV